MKVSILVFITFFTANVFSQEKPKSLPNDGETDREWTIDEYADFVKIESDKCPESLKKKSEQINNKFQRTTIKIKANRYDNELNKVPIDEKEYEKSIKLAEKTFNDEINALETYCETQFQKNSKYRDEWVTYLKAKAIQDKLDEEKLEKEEIEKKKNEELARVEQEEKDKIAEDLSIANFKKTLNSIEYKNWKIKYLSIIKSADVNIIAINALEKKYSFINKFGNRVWDPARLSKLDKINYNKNYDAIGKKLNDVKEFQKIGSNEKFLDYYENSVLTSSVNGVELYKLSQFYNSHERQY